ncbi:hypothetical protein B0T22DRAFT_81965 [Podospora appendiculata]|uniref:Uncharacterized protein n=1 Tax=Podospora appendiculata TaxID=314037 RepID=A0AAE1CHR2_9PEZI|nr:hypothetical protein B0T22DRAFT_81965 [Podospora appendiculata]
MDKRAKLADPRQPVSHLVTHQHLYRPPNYRYQCSEPAHQHLYEQSDYRESLGSDCSVPGMVDDHGSDVSTEDDYQYHAVGTEVWDSFWHAQPQNGISTRPPHSTLMEPRLRGRWNTRHHQDSVASVAERENKPPTVRLVSNTAEQPDQPSWPLPLSSPGHQRPRTPKAPPRASYSLFPPTEPQSPDKQRPLPPRRSSLSRPQIAGSFHRQHASQPSLNSRKQSIDATITLVTPSRVPSAAGQASSMTPALATTHDSPASPSTVRLLPSPIISSWPPSHRKPGLEPHERPQTAGRRPSLASLRKHSFSRVPTQSSPALRHLAQTHSQDPESTQQKPKLQHFISHAVLERPLPPLPNFAPELSQPSTPPPPNVSFFDLDSDDSDTGTTGEESRSFARRFMRGFVSSHNRSRDTSKGSHQRSASDSKSDATNTYKTTQTRRARADTTGAVASSHGGSSRSSLRRPETKEDDKDARPWLSRQSSDVFGRFLGRRGS